MKENKDKNSEVQENKLLKTEDMGIEEIARDEKVAELEILKQSLEEYKKKAQSYYEQILQVRADFDNFRKRTEREKKENFETGKKTVIIELLDIYDTMKLAKTMIEKSEKIESVKEGLHLIEKKLAGILKSYHVEPIETIGKKYDLHLHEVIEVVEKEGVEDNTIIEEIQSGYKIKDTVLKPAIVKIAKAKNKQNNGKENKEEFNG